MQLVIAVVHGLQEDDIAEAETGLEQQAVTEAPEASESAPSADPVKLVLRIGRGFTPEPVSFLACNMSCFEDITAMIWHEWGYMGCMLLKPHSGAASRPPVACAAWGMLEYTILPGMQDAVAGTPERKAQDGTRMSESPDTTPPARRPRFGVWVSATVSVILQHLQSSRSWTASAGQPAGSLTVVEKGCR